MKLERISYQYSDGTVAGYDFHPRVTVIDVHPAHRRALVDHLVAALSTSAPGVHVEATFDDGASVVAFRPHGATHRVIDIERGGDLTERFRREDSVDLLVPLELDLDRVASTLVASGTELVAPDPTDAWLGRLLRHDTDRLLVAARDVTDAERELREATAAAKGSPDEAAAVDGAIEVRDRTNALERRHNRVRIATLVLGTALPIAAVVGLNTIGTSGAVGLIGGSVVLAGGCLAYERRLARAVDAEYEALAAAGSSSYLDLEERIATTGLGDPTVRARLVDAARRFRDVTATWQDLAGDIPAPWVLGQEARIRELATLRTDSDPLPSPSTGPEPSSAALVAGLWGRASAVGDLCPAEKLPLFLDDPLSELSSWDDKVPVLEVLGRLSERQQVVLCTDDREVLSWAEAEAVGGAVSVVDANPSRRATQPGASAAAT